MKIKQIFIYGLFGLLSIAFLIGFIGSLCGIGDLSNMFKTIHDMPQYGELYWPTILGWFCDLFVAVGILVLLVFWLVKNRNDDENAVSKKAKILFICYFGVLFVVLLLTVINSFIVSAKYSLNYDGTIGVVALVLLAITIVGLLLSLIKYSGDSTMEKVDLGVTYLFGVVSLIFVMANGAQALAIVQGVFLILAIIVAAMISLLKNVAFMNNAITEKKAESNNNDTNENK